MLTGKIKDLPKLLPYVAADLQKALQYIAATDFSKMANGQYEIDGDKIFVRVNTYTTEPVRVKKWEAHDAYIDVQYLGQGHEQINYAARSRQPLLENKLQEQDVAFFGPGASVKADGGVEIGEGAFAVFFPWELHQPGCETGVGAEPVQKIVVKVKAL